MSGTGLLLPMLLQGAAVTPARVQSTPPPAATRVEELGPNLERFAYPWPVKRMRVAVAFDEPATMAYMDVAPTAPANGRTAVLLHGKNFCGATWEATARVLAARGWRVVIPDQIGFCKSSKPEIFQYSLAGLAATTDALLRSLGVARAAVVGHSMGGMLAMRYAIHYPQRTERLVLVNPLGLVDRMAQGVPYTSVAGFLETERKTSAASIKAYQLKNYYHGQWRAEYDRWVGMLAGMYVGPNRDVVALAQAKTSQMILTQPVVYELGRIKAPTTMLIGVLDETAFGRALVPPTLAEYLKTIPQVAPGAVRQIPGARLVRMEGLGHSPQVEAPERFAPALLEALDAR